ASPVTRRTSSNGTSHGLSSRATTPRRDRAPSPRSASHASRATDRVVTTTTAGGPRRTVAGGVLRIELPGAPLDAGLATAISELVPAADDLDAPAVVLLTTPPDGEFAGLGVEPAGGALPAGLRDGHPGGEVARCVAAVAAFP